MFDGIKDELRTLREAQPGTRFERGHERHRVRNHVVRLLLICLGLGLALGGALTFWIPGPNFVIVLAGLAIVAAQWRAVARRLDRIEVALRRWNDERWDPYPHKRRVLVLGWLVAVLVIALAVYGAWRADWLPAWLPFIG
jgi:Mn2+/Fe2+ NRAMP family transporter